MTTSHEAGPFVVFGITTSLPTPDYNPDIGTSLFWAGAGTLDQRPNTYWCYAPGNNSYQGWLGVDRIFSLNYVPSALATNNLAASQTPTTAVTLALVTASAAGATISASVVNALTGASVGGLLLIDGLTAAATGSITGSVFFAASGASGTFTVGSVLSGTGVTTNTTIIGMSGHAGTTGAGGVGTYIVTPAQSVTSQVVVSGVAGINGVPLIPGNIQVVSPMPGSPLGISGSKTYNPQCMVGRNVRITTASGDTAVYTVRGYDIYGFPMTEAITAAGATTVSGKKAFKYVASVTPVGTVGATAAIGTGDVYGFPLFSLTFQDVSILWSATVVTSNTGYLAGDLTNPATTTTGDTRGTYAIQTASNNAARLSIWQGPQPQAITSISGLFGTTQT